MRTLLVVSIFIELQIAFDIVSHDIRLSKLSHCGIRGVAFDWFKSYLIDRTQYVAMNNQKSEIQTTKHGVIQGSVLGHSLFVIYINDLTRSIKNSKIHYFADDANLLYASSSLKEINKTINFDLLNLVQRDSTNKKALNVNKTVIVTFALLVKSLKK